jgi:hypothetical protein
MADRSWPDPQGCERLKIGVEEATLCAYSKFALSLAAAPNMMRMSAWPPALRGI